MQDGSPRALRWLTATAVATVLIGFSLLVLGEHEPEGYARVHSGSVVAATATSADASGLRILGADAPCDVPEPRAVLAAASGAGPGDEDALAPVHALPSDAEADYEPVSFSDADEEVELRHLAVLGIVLIGAGALGLAARRGRRHVVGVGAAMLAIVGVALFWKLCAGLAAPPETDFARGTPAPIEVTEAADVAGPYLGAGNGHTSTQPFEPTSFDEASQSDDVAAWADEQTGPSHRLLVLLGVGVLGAGALGAASRFGRRRFSATAFALLGFGLIALLWYMCSGTGVYQDLLEGDGVGTFTRTADATGTSGLAAGAGGLPQLAQAGVPTQVRGGGPAVAFRSGAGSPGGARGAAGLPAVGAGAGGSGPRAAWGPVDGSFGATYLSDPGAIVSVGSDGPPAVWWKDGDSTGGGAGEPPVEPPTPAIPEPGAGLLFAAGLVAAASRLRRRG